MIPKTRDESSYKIYVVINVAILEPSDPFNRCHQRLDLIEEDEEKAREKEWSYLNLIKVMKSDSIRDLSGLDILSESFR